MQEYITATYVFREIGSNDEWLIGQSQFDSIHAYSSWTNMGRLMFGNSFEIVQTYIPSRFHV